MTAKQAKLKGLKGWAKRNEKRVVYRRIMNLTRWLHAHAALK